jgi:hypothetical protein
MVNTFGTALAVPLFFAHILLTPVVIEAQNLADHDAKEIAEYMLTEPALAKYTQAVHKLQPLMAQLAQECDREEGSTSLNDMATRMDGVSGVKPALKAAGMTSREYLVFSWSVFQSGMAVLAVQQPGGKLPPGVKMANVNFHRTHEAELTKLGELTTHADCDNR